MMFGGFQRTSLVDYPGRVASVAFAAGCNMRCGYCFNSPLVLMKTPLVAFEKILCKLKRGKKIIDAVVVSGGEPTAWPDLPECLGQLKAEGFSVKLDSNGGRPEVLEKVLHEKLVDYIAMDVKAPWKKYAEATRSRIPVGNFAESVRLIKQSGVEHEFRTTAAPGLSAGDVRQIASQVRPAKKWFLQPFVPAECVLDPGVLQQKWLSPSELEEIAGECKKFFGECRVRGVQLPGGAERNARARAEDASLPAAGINIAQA